jgi:hypothetical protein
MSEIKLVFDEVKPKKKAPEHLADLTIAERRAKAESLGLPATISLTITKSQILGAIFQLRCAH